MTFWEMFAGIFKRAETPEKSFSSSPEVHSKTEDAVRTPSHLKEYLDYYRNLEHPEFAVLITGEWGTGKTYQVRQAIPENDAYYVSLFGLSSADDIVAAVYSAMFPKKAALRRTAERIGDVSAEVPGIGSFAVSGISSALVGAFLRQEVSLDKPIIFDDLERSSLSTKELLGVINLYVEHHGCRVIVIAHDGKLTKDFVTAKEKLFGHSIRVAPQSLPAFDRFHSEISDVRAKDFLATHRDDILGVFTESQTASLRILRHVMQDLSRLIAHLSDEHLSHSEAMSELTKLFCALDIEWRSSRLQSGDLRKRNEADIAYNMSSKKQEREVPRIVSAGTRYPTLELTSTLLSDDALVEMLEEGQYNEQTIRQSLDASSYFVKPQESPPWLIVASFDKLEDTDVDIGLWRMQLQIDGREITESGEMLHVFALRMMMASRGILGKDVDAVAKECIAYIDDLLANGKLAPRELDWRWYDSFEMSAHGYSYWIHKEYEGQFKAVYEHLIHSREKALEREFPRLSPELLATMQRDGLTFYRQVCHTNVGKSEYAEIPILASIAPSAFIAAWMRTPKSNWYWITGALRDRYSGNKLSNSLAVEASWISDVIKLLNIEADKAVGLAKVRILRAIPAVSIPSV